MGNVRPQLDELSDDELLSIAELEFSSLLRNEERWSAFRAETSPVFLPLLSPARYKGAHGGRGSGKSHFFAAYVVVKCATHPGMRGVCVREIQKSLRESVKLLIEDKIRALGLADQFVVQQDVIRTPGGGLIVFQGMQDHTAESIKSLEGFDWAYVEEAQTLTERSLEMLRPTIRKPGSELLFSWNPRHASDPVDQLLRGMELPPDAIVVQANYSDNKFFPGVLEEERKFDYRNNPQRYDHIWRGAYEPQAVGAIWSRDVIHKSRVAEAPQLTRIVVAIDPAVSAEKGSNETGIVACGLGVDDRGYVLEDYSCIAAPEEWARRAITLFDLLGADAIIIETNQGGDMCRATLQALRPGMPVVEVTATRGKHVRAEPISALYSVGKISHVGAFPELEHQMCSITADGYVGEGSPDRADAMVWAMTSLFKKMTQRPQSAPQFRVLESRPRRMIGR